MARQYGLESLFETASEHFPRIRAALNQVSDRFLFPGRNTPDRLMRQVRDGVRWRRAAS
jgi:hypothetical protein